MQLWSPSVISFLSSKTSRLNWDKPRYSKPLNHVRATSWHCVLDEEASLLTTFALRFRRYLWCRLPFGWSMSSEIFQKRVNQTLAGLEGVLDIVDDVLIYGVGDRRSKAPWAAHGWIGQSQVYFFPCGKTVFVRNYSYENICHLYIHSHKNQVFFMCTRSEKEANGNSEVEIKSAYVPSGPLGQHLFQFLWILP